MITLVILLVIPILIMSALIILNFYQLFETYFLKFLIINAYHKRHLFNGDDHALTADPQSSS